MAYVTIRQTHLTLKNGKKSILEENCYEFCDDLWREIKSYLFTDCCAKCATKTDDLTCIPSATAYYDGRFVINSTWICRFCALDARDIIWDFKTKASFKSAHGSIDRVVKDIGCVFKHPNVLRGGATGFRLWMRSTSPKTLPGRLSLEINRKNRLVKPKGMRWEKWNNVVNACTAEELSFKNAHFSLNLSCSRETGPLIDYNMTIWIKKYFAEQKADWALTLKK
jgi:hypothetical protein